MKSIQIHVESDINAPIEKVFEFVTNPNNIPLVLPGLIENTNIPELPIKVGDKFNFKYLMFGIVIEGLTTIDKIESPNVYDYSTYSGISSHWKESLSSNNGGTHFTLDVEYEPPQSWIEKIKINIIKNMNIKTCENFLHNINSVLELQS